MLISVSAAVETLTRSHAAYPPDRAAASASASFSEPHPARPTAALVFSAAGALLSALCFGYNNANMNTQAAVMRHALGIPAVRPTMATR